MLVTLAMFCDLQDETGAAEYHRGRLKEHLPEEVFAFLDRRGQDILEEIDDWLNEHRVDESDSSITPIRLGLGVYAIEGALPEGTQS